MSLTNSSVDSRNLRNIKISKQVSRNYPKHKHKEEKTDNKAYELFKEVMTGDTFPKITKDKKNRFGLKNTNCNKIKTQKHYTNTHKRIHHIQPTIFKTR